MDCVIVSSEDELKKVVSERETKGLRLAAASNAGLPLGKARLTFLPASCFKNEEGAA